MAPLVHARRRLAAAAASIGRIGRRVATGPIAVIAAITTVAALASVSPAEAYDSPAQLKTVANVYSLGVG